MVFLRRSISTANPVIFRYVSGMTFSRISLSVILILAISPLLASWQPSRRHETHQVLAVGVRAELYCVSGIGADRHGNIFVSDLLGYALKKFDPAGRFLGQVGRRGTGPGEFRAPALVLIRHDTVAVLQMEDPRVELFGTDLEYKRTFRVECGSPIDMACSREGDLHVATYGSDSSHGVVLVFSGLGRGAPRRIVLEPTGRKNPLFTACRIAVRQDGTLAVAYVFMNRVEFYDRNGKLRKRFSIPGMPGMPVMPVMNELEGDSLGLNPPVETYFKQVVNDPRGNILLLGGSRSPHPGRDLFVVSPGGRCLSVRTLPVKSRTIAVDDKGFLYGTDKDGTAVFKYLLH